MHTFSFHCLPRIRCIFPISENIPAAAVRQGYFLFLIDRKLNPKRIHAAFAFSPDLSSVILYDSLCDGQSQTIAPIHGSNLINAIEALEYILQFLPGQFCATANFDLLLRAKEAADRHGYRYQIGTVNCTDVFYRDGDPWREWAKMGVLASEMESFALYCNAAAGKAKALAMFTVSDSLVTGEEMSAIDRQNSFTNMMTVALETACGI